MFLLPDDDDIDVLFSFKILWRWAFISFCFWSCLKSSEIVKLRADSVDSCDWVVDWCCFYNNIERQQTYYYFTNKYLYTKDDQYKCLILCYKPNHEHNCSWAIAVLFSSWLSDFSDLSSSDEFSEDENIVVSCCVFALYVSLALVLFYKIKVRH